MRAAGEAGATSVAAPTSAVARERVNRQPRWPRMRRSVVDGGRHGEHAFSTEGNVLRVRCPRAPVSVTALTLAR